MKEIFDYALKKKKKVVLISDMYLPKEVIKKLLKKAGYKDVPVYISCEYYETKGDMGLYRLVLKEEKLKKSTWVHIGDNKCSDYEKAREFGIEAVLYENVREKDKLAEPESIEASIMRGIQNNLLYNGNAVPYWEKFGILYASPIYYGFAHWLYRLTKDEDNLFFLARDGYIVKKMYDDFRSWGGANIKTYYLYGSRKTFQLPALLHKTKDELMDFLVVLADNYDVELTVGDMLKNLNLEFEKYKEKLKIFGFESESDLIDEDNCQEIKKFLKYVYKDVEKELKEQEKLALEYLKQEGFYKYDKINIMDIGWGGSLQEALKVLTGKDIMGYYFGTIPTKKVDILGNSVGYAFDEARPSQRYMEIFNMPMMYEFIFSAPHGTTTGFKREGKKIVAVVDEDDGAYVDVVNTLQEAALKATGVYMKYAHYLEEIRVEDSIANYTEMIRKRDYEDLIEFKKLTNSVLYTNNKSKYIDEFDEDYIYSHYDEFLAKKHRALWRDSYFVKGIKTKEQWLAHEERLEDFLRKKGLMPLKKKDYIKEGVKNPKRAMRFIKHKIVGY